MKPVPQSKVGADGDCLPACVASILELPLDAVPHFNALYRENWKAGLDRFLLDHQLCPLFIRWDDDLSAWLQKNRLHSIVTLRTAAGTLHSTVYFGAFLSHDPGAPSVEMVGDPVDVLLFVRRT